MIFFFASSFTSMLFSFRIWDVMFLWTVYCSLSLESVTAKYSRAIMVANYFLLKTEARKVSGFVCWSESVVQLTVDNLPPTSGVAVPRLEAAEFWPAFVILWATCQISLCLKCSKTRTMVVPWSGGEGAVQWCWGRQWQWLHESVDSALWDETGLEPSTAVGVPAVVIYWVPALLLPDLDSWLPSRPSVHKPAVGAPLESLVQQVLLRSFCLGMPEGRTQGELTLTRTSSVQQPEWGEFIKEQMENSVCVCYSILK